MRYSNHEYWCPRSTKVVSVVIGLCLFIVGAYFGNHFSDKSNDASIVYRKALADRMAILTRAIETEDNPTGDSTATYQSLLYLQDQLHEVAKNAVELRNRFDSTANRFILLSLFGACIALAPMLLYLVRVAHKFF